MCGIKVTVKDVPLSPSEPPAHKKEDRPLSLLTCCQCGQMSVEYFQTSLEFLQDQQTLKGKSAKVGELALKCSYHVGLWIGQKKQPYTHGLYMAQFDVTHSTICIYIL